MSEGKRKKEMFVARCLFLFLYMVLIDHYQLKTLVNLLTSIIPIWGSSTLIHLVAPSDSPTNKQLFWIKKGRLLLRIYVFLHHCLISNGQGGNSFYKSSICRVLTKQPDFIVSHEQKWANKENVQCVTKMQEHGFLNGM